MKFLGVLLLAACALAAHHHGHHGHHAKHHYKHAMQSRALNVTDKICELACGANEPQSFTIDLTASLNIKIVYNAKLRILAFINIKLKIAFVFTSKAQIYAIVSADGIIVVNGITGVAIYVDVKVGAALFVEGQVNLYDAVATCGQTISDNSKGVIGSLVELVKNANAFILAEFLAAAARGDVALKLVYALKLKLVEKILASFGVIITFVRSVAYSAQVAVFGNLAIFLSLFQEGAIKVGVIFLTVTITLFTAVAGFVDAFIIVQVYIQISYFIDVVKSGAAQLITIGANFAVQVYITGSAVISLATNGVLCLADEVVGSIKDIAVRNSVFGSVSAQVNVNVAVSFQAAGAVVAG